MSGLGNKHECSSCGTKFYDLEKSEIICPKCGWDQKDQPDPDEKSKAAKKSAGSKRKTAKKTKKAAAKKKKKKAASGADEPSESEGSGNESD